MIVNVSKGIKVSISSSINRSFVQYMKEIGWDDSKYDSDQFIQYLLKYSKENASWYSQISKDMFKDQSFQQQLINKVNETIKKIIETEPTAEQVNQINELVKTLGVEDVDYCCKAEAEFYIQTLRKELK